ncbi:MAG: cation transporter [Reyranella sp.]|uniref:cation diffusion facilitator family transporter n=1 Tax=Reyranella sp. TaxID=1929291 RepID=UPI001ACC3C72|nr:cation diffusion facilitator family transporter [Reyranella sp.]MBN9087144.1 cation transporter [Reyranella sp.]
MAAHQHHDHDHSGHDHSGHRHGPGGHSHSHAPANFDRAFLIGITLNVGFVIVEAVYGFLANSLALLADAGHNLGDVLGLLLAWVAASLAKRKPSARFTYGMKRTPILASLANAMLLLVASGAIIYEAINRLQSPAPVAEMTVIWVALVGIVINGVTALGFVAGRKNDINIRGAFLHMVADAVVSLGVVLSGLLVLFTGWLWVDPAVSIIVAVVIVVGTWSLLKESVSLSLDAVPASIDRTAIERYLTGLPGVSEVHDLHIWPMSTTEVALTAHLVRPGAPLDDSLLSQACRDLSTRFGIQHATLQIEAGDPAHPCTLAPSEVV